MAIYQDLVEQFGFTHKYISAKRFVRGLKNKDPRQYDRLWFLPGEVAQVSFGSCKPSHLRAVERYAETNRLCPGRKQNWLNLLSQTRAYAHEIALSWSKPTDIHAGGRLNKGNRHVGLGYMVGVSKSSGSLGIRFYMPMGHWRLLQFEDMGDRIKEASFGLVTSNRERSG
jgi:hypothetical protein